MSFKLILLPSNEQPQLGDLVSYNGTLKIVSKFKPNISYVYWWW